MPKAPILELAYYFHSGVEGNSADVFSNFVQSLIQLGCRPSGYAEILRGNKIRRRDAFLSRSDDAVIVTRSDSVADLLSDEHVRVISVGLESASGRVAGGERDLVTHLGISELALGDCAHPIAIWTNGEIAEIQLSDEQHDDWERIEARFRSLCLSSRPSYAALSSDASLLCPYDLLREPEAFFFDQFYLAQGNALEADLARHVWDIDWAVEPAEFGSFVTSRDVSPSGREAFVTLARTIATTFAEI